jgi:hypothetical protein
MRYPIQLSAGTLLCIRDGRGALVRVHRGTVVLTHERDAEDHVIRSGEAFVVQRGGKTVVTAAAEAALVLDDAPASRIELKKYVGGRPVAQEVVELRSLGQLAQLVT